MIKNEDNEKIYNLVSLYSNLYRVHKKTHRKMAKILNIKDWVAYNCHIAMEDLRYITAKHIKEVKNSDNVSKAMKKTKLSRYTVRYLLYYHDIKIGYSYDQDFFSKDTPESFYWAGFIAADGNVEKNSNTLCIGLSSKDKDHLEKFKIAINSNNPIVSFKSYIKEKVHNGVNIRITCSKIKKDLVRFNIVPAKTHIYKMPEWLLGHKYINHFMRGYVDGDGSFFITDHGKSLTFSLCGIEDFLKQCQILLKAEDITPNKIQKKNECRRLHEIQHRGNICTKKIFDFLYADSDDLLRMGRKYDLANNHLSSLPPKKYVYVIKNGKVLDKFSTQIDCARAYNLDKQGVNKCLRGGQKTHRGYEFKLSGGAKEVVSQVNE